MPRRRTVLVSAALGGLGLATAMAVNSADDPAADRDPSDDSTEDQVPQPRTIEYGDDPAQFVELWQPSGPSRGVVVVIHGGFWKAAYDLSYGRPLAADLAARGWTACNIEYRRVGNGGGLPATFDDVAAAIDLLADVDGLDTSTVVALGHSAGGHLAAWSAARGRFPRWPQQVPVTHVIAQAGVLDLGSAYRDNLGGGAVQALIGEPPGPAYDEVDPTRQLPLEVPVWCVHATGDDVVPLSQSREYVDRARAAGGTAELVEVEGDHFVVIDPDSEAWRRTLEILDAL